jgi:hypothetical protein
MTISKAGITIELRDSENTLIDTQVTDENGLARFDSVPIGIYKTDITIPPGYAFVDDHVENTLVDSNAVNNVISAPFGDGLIEGIDVTRNNTSVGTFIIAMTRQLFMGVSYTPGVGMTLTMNSVDPVAEETVVVINWQLIGYDLNNGTVIRHSGMESTFTIANGETTSNLVVVSNGFDNGSGNGLDPAPVADDWIVLEIVSKPSYVLIPTLSFSLGGENNF